MRPPRVETVARALDIGNSSVGAMGYRRLCPPCQPNHSLDFRAGGPAVRLCFCSLSSSLSPSLSLEALCSLVTPTFATYRLANVGDHRRQAIDVSSTSTTQVRRLVCRVGIGQRGHEQEQERLDLAPAASDIADC